MSLIRVIAAAALTLRRDDPTLIDADGIVLAVRAADWPTCSPDCPVHRGGISVMHPDPDDTVLVVRSSKPKKPQRRRPRNPIEDILGALGRHGHGGGDFEAFMESMRGEDHSITEVMVVRHAVADLARITCLRPANIVPSSIPFIPGHDDTAILSAYVNPNAISTLVAIGSTSYEGESKIIKSLGVTVYGYIAFAQTVDELAEAFGVPRVSVPAAFATTGG